MISHSSYQQPWCSEDSGQILSYDLPSQLETETKSIMIFHDYMELCADMYHYSSDVCPHAVPSSVLPVPLINPVQESCGQSDTNNSYQTSLVSNEEHFEIFPSNRTWHISCGLYNTLGYRWFTTLLWSGTMYGDICIMLIVKSACFITTLFL